MRRIFCFLLITCLSYIISTSVANASCHFDPQATKSQRYPIGNASVKESKVNVEEIRAQLEGDPSLV